MPFLCALCRGLLSLSLGAYFGAVTMSAIAAITTFQILDPDRETAGRVAGTMFARLDILTTILIVVAAISLAGALALRAYPRIRALSLGAGVILLTAAWGLSVFWINPRIVGMQRAGLTQEPAFHRLHKTSERSLGMQGLFAGVLAITAAAGGRASSRESE